MRRRPLLLAVLAGAFLATPALADVTVRYRAVLPAAAPANVRENPPTMSISADGAGLARWDMAAPGTPGGASLRAPTLALIVRDGAIHIVASTGQPGMQIIARMDDALAFGAGIAGPILQGPARSGVEQVMGQRVEIVPVGPETVSGVRGNLYRVVLVSGETRSPPLEVVIATDPRLAPIGQEFARLFETLRPTVLSLLGSEPQVYMAMRGLAGLGAPIRIGNEMRIESVSTDELPDSHFALPGPVLTREQLQQILGMMMGAMGQGGRPPGMPTPPAPATPATPPGNATDPQ